MSEDNLSLWKLGLVLVDLIGINLAYLIIIISNLGHLIPGIYFSTYLSVAPWISISAVLIFYIFDLYSGWIFLVFNKAILSMIAALVIANLLALGMLYSTQTFANVPLSVFILAPIIAFLLSALFRLPVWYIYQRYDSDKKVLVVGEDVQESLAISKKFFNNAKSNFNISSLVYSDDIKEIEAKIKSLDIDIVAISSNLVQEKKLIDLCLKEHKEIFLVPDFIAVLLNSSETRYVDDTLMLALKPPGIKPGQQFLKRAFDIASSLTFLGLLSPLMIFITLIIHLTSPGPALYKQERLGKSGRSFYVIKFRSMVNNAEGQTGPVLAAHRDPRITKFGSFLRATRLDEFPQFINVLRGDMSVVGPRPEREFFINQYTETIPYYRYRMEVKPGITGLAQVMGKYTTSPEDKLRFDLMYIRNYSFILDLKILLLTVRVVFQREKASGLEINLNKLGEKMVS